MKKHKTSVKTHFSAFTRFSAALRRPFLCLVCFCALMYLSAPMPPSRATAASIDGHYTTASLSTQEHIAGNLLNSDRSAYSLHALTLDPELCRIARIKSEDMRDNKYFAHTSPTYGSVQNMLDHFGYEYAAAGENIARHATIEKSQAALISSPAHRQNILSRSFTRAGVGVAQDENGFIYLTQIFCH